MMNCFQPVDLKKACKRAFAVFALVYCSGIAAFAAETEELEDLLDDFEETFVFRREFCIVQPADGLFQRICKAVCSRQYNPFPPGAG